MEGCNKSRAGHRGCRPNPGRDVVASACPPRRVEALVPPDHRIYTEASAEVMVKSPPNRLHFRANASGSRGVRRGFTLVELLAVMVIIGIILAFILTAAMDSIRRAEERATQSLI